MNSSALNIGVSEALIEAGKKYGNLVVLTDDFAELAGVTKFGQIFEERCFSFGLGQENMVGAAAGFALRNKMPVLVGSAQLFGAIRSHLCLGNLNVKVIGLHGGLAAGQEGAPYQDVSDIAVMRALPNMKVLCPADSAQAAACLEAMLDDYGPSYLRLPAGEFQRVHSGSVAVEFGKGTVLREGSDVCIFTMGSMLRRCLDAAEFLAGKGVSCVVVDMVSVKPLDQELVKEWAGKVRACVVVEDHSVIGGLGAAVDEVVGGVLRLGVKDSFGESGRLEDLYRKHGLDVEGIVSAIENHR